MQPDSSPRVSLRIYLAIVFALFVVSVSVRS